MSTPFLAEELLKRREARGWSQGALAFKAGVSRSVVSHWETGRGAPDRKQAARLDKLFAEEASADQPQAKQAKTHKVKKPEAKQAKAPKVKKPKAPETIAAWVTAQRTGAKLALEALAKKAGLRAGAVGSIEEGQAPWPRKRTRRRLEKVLGELPYQTAARAKEQARVYGFGVLTDFDPHDPKDHPKEAGLFVLYDGASRPVHVGQSKNMRKRFEALSTEAWFKAPTVERAAFLVVDDGALREALASLLVRTLRGALLVRTRHNAD